MGLIGCFCRVFGYLPLIFGLRLYIVGYFRCNMRFLHRKVHQLLVADVPCLTFAKHFCFFDVYNLLQKRLFSMVYKSYIKLAPHQANKFFIAPYL